MSLCCTLVFCRFFIIIIFFPLWLSVSLDLDARVALGSSFYPYLDVQECDTSRYALRNFNIFWPAALKKMCVRVSVCGDGGGCWWWWWGGWGRIHGNTPPPPPLGPKRQSLTHTHVHTCTRSTTGPAEPDQYFSPFKEQNSENGFSAPRLQPCFRPWVFTLNTQSAKWRGFFVLTQNNSWPESFLFFHFTVLMDPFSPGRTSVLLSIFVWFPPIFLSLFSYFLLLPSLHFLSLPLRVSDRVRLHSASSLFVSPCGWPRLRSQQVSPWSPGASKSISEAEGLDWPWPSGPVGWLEEGWVVWLWGSPWLLSVGKMEESSL